MRRPFAVPCFSAVVLAGLSALTLAPGCTCGSAHLQVARDFGNTAAALPELQITQACLVMARAIVEHRGRAAVPSPPPAPGRRVMLAVFRPGSDALVGTASGATLSDAVAGAADAIATRAPGPLPPEARLEMDVPVSDGLGAVSLASDIEVPVVSIGLEGVLVAGGDGEIGFILPGEIGQRGMYHTDKSPGLDRGKIAALLASRVGVAETHLASMRTYRFHTEAYVESPSHDTGAPPLHVFRGMVEHPTEATPELLLAAVRRGADYLVRVMSAEGRFVYLYHPFDERRDTSYGWLRHAGSTYALLEAYEEFGTPSYAEKAELALQYLKKHFRDDPESEGKYVLDSKDEEQQKVGGAGLALLAFAKYAAVTGDRSDLETMRALARLIMKQQDPSGHFRANVDIQKPDGKKLKREPVYYPGEAVLGLIRFYALDPQDAYLDAARRGADWVLNVRDAHTSLDHQEHDHWMSYALNDLYRVTHDDAYVEHAYKIARAIQKKQHGPADGPTDWAGTFYEGETTPASTRVEAYDADIALSRFAGKPEDWLVTPAKRVASAMLGQQFRVDNDYWLRNPSMADGGVRESLIGQDVRIDFVQHAMSAWLHLARILRDPAYGKTGVPSQDPVHAAAGDTPSIRSRKGPPRSRAT
jgi:hypothetical protein